MSGGVGVTGLIANLPNAITPYPTQDPALELGGFRSLANSVARTGILPQFRAIGMVVVEQDTGFAFQALGGILDANWSPFCYQNVTTTDGGVLPRQPNLEFRSSDFIASDDPAVSGTRIRLNGILLPTVTGADNGATIEVVGGAWAIVENARIRLTAQVAAIAATNVFTALPAAGIYRVSAFLDVTTAGTAGTTLATRVNFTPDDGVASFSIITSARDIGTLGGSQGSAIIEADGVHQITYEVDLVGAIGTGVYSLRLVVEPIS